MFMMMMIIYTRTRTQRDTRTHTQGHTHTHTKGFPGSFATLSILPSKLTRNVCIFFCGELQGRETICSLAHAQDVVKWRAMVMCFRKGGEKKSLNSDELFFPTDLAHSDFHLFCGPKKDVIRGKMSGSDNNVIEEVGKWVRVQTLTLRRLMSHIYMEHLFLMFLDHTQHRSTVGSTPLDE